jgi:hypothetical protein
VCLFLLAEHKTCYVVNVYAKCDIQAKRRLWDNISMSKQGFGRDLWCVVGDFNSVRVANERRGLTGDNLTNNLA